MSAERTPVMALVAPFFEGLISEWRRMRTEPGMEYLSKMLDVGINKLEVQYTQYRFSKAVIMSTGDLTVSFPLV